MQDEGVIESADALQRFLTRYAGVELTPDQRDILIAASEHFNEFSRKGLLSRSDFFQLLLDPSRNG